MIHAGLVSSEEGDEVVSEGEKATARALAADAHSQELRVEIPGSAYIGDGKGDVIQAGGSKGAVRGGRGRR